MAACNGGREHLFVVSDDWIAALGQIASSSPATPASPFFDVWIARPLGHHPAKAVTAKLAMAGTADAPVARWICHFVSDLAKSRRGYQRLLS